jgi:hypothetical protein
MMLIRQDKRKRHPQDFKAKSRADQSSWDFTPASTCRSLHVHSLAVCGCVMHTWRLHKLACTLPQGVVRTVLLPCGFGDSWLSNTLRDPSTSGVNSNLKM